MFKFNFLIFSVSLSLILGACAKDPKSVSDPGPDFSVSSMEINILSKGPNPAPIVRNDPTSGPQIQVQGVDYSSIKSVDKKLVCGPVTLQGKKVFAGDASLINFRLAEEEFPDLSKMPAVAKCTLAVTVTNNIGSTTTKTIPVTLTFDKNPPLEILRSVATVGLNPYNSNFEIGLESYSIKNNLPYPVSLSFTPSRQVMALTRVNSAVETGATRSDDLYDLKFSIKTTRIEISGLVTNETGDYIHGVKFTLPVGNAVTLIAYGQIPNEGTARNCVAWVFPAGSRMCRTFTGLFVAGVSEPSRSLSILWGFEPGPDDLSKTNYINFKDDFPNPGITPAPVLNKHDLGIN